MQLITPLLLALTTQVAAFDLYYFCTQNTQGACCMDLDPASGAGKSCNPSTSVYSFVDPGAPQWVCLNNVNRVPACCLGPVKGGSMKCEAPIEPPFPSATPKAL